VRRAQVRGHDRREGVSTRNRTRRLEIVKLKRLFDVHDPRATRRRDRRASLPPVRPADSPHIRLPLPREASRKSEERARRRFPQRRKQDNERRSGPGRPHEGRRSSGSREPRPSSRRPEPWRLKNDEAPFTGPSPDDNPVEETLKRREADPKELLTYSPGQVQVIARHAADETIAAHIVTAAMTGLRLGELLELRWRDVRFAESVIHTAVLQRRARRDLRRRAGGGGLCLWPSSGAHARPAGRARPRDRDHETKRGVLVFCRAAAGIWTRRRAAGLRSCSETRRCARTATWRS
jgi:integrase